MSKRRLVITALFIEKQSVAEVAARYGVHRSWVYRLKACYETEGEAALEPRSRRPHTYPTAISHDTVQLIVRLRKQLSEAGMDAGPDTIAWHLNHHHHLTVSVSTVARTLTRQGLTTPEPKKRPRSSYIRFEADQPNECWQSDFTHYRLADGVEVEIITWLDDHSRYALHISAHARISGPIVLATFRQTVAEHGLPASTLTDNGMVYTTRFAGGKGGRSSLEHELRKLGITQKNSAPNHPTTCGKVERYQQTMKNWLTAQPHQPTTINQLQTLLNRFRDTYNQHRPHRSLPHQATPATTYTARPKATPTTSSRDNDTHNRVRTDIIDKSGSVTLRINGRLHHIGIGRTHARTRVLLLVHDLHVRIIHAATGELLRDLEIDPTHDYQPTGQPPGPTRPQPPT